MLSCDENSDAMGAGHGEIAGAVLIDVRRAPAYAQSGQMLPGAVWRDPAALAEWAGTLDGAQSIIVYCVHGHEVSRNAAAQLCALGIKARFLQGGFEGWKDAGLPLVSKTGPRRSD